MSVNLEQVSGKEGADAEVVEPPPQLAKPKDDNSAKAVAAPSFNSSRRVKFPIALNLDAVSGAKVGPHSNSVDLKMRLVSFALSPGPGRSSAILTIPNDEGWELDDPVQVSISMGTTNEVALDKRNKRQKAS
jgi:hypothetical protein